MQCTRMTTVLITALMVAGGLGNTAEAREPVRHGAPQARGLAVVDHLPAHERHTVSEHGYQHRGHRYRHRRHFSGNRHRYQRGAPDHLGKPEHRRIILDSIREAFRQGARGPAHDLALFTRPWGFDPASIVAPVHLWHGRLDRTVPCRHGEWIAGRLRRCEPHLSDNEGHFSLLLEHMRSIMNELVDDQ